MLNEREQIIYSVLFFILILLINLMNTTRWFVAILKTLSLRSSKFQKQVKKNIYYLKPSLNYTSTI